MNAKRLFTMAAMVCVLTLAGTVTNSASAGAILKDAQRSDVPGTFVWYDLLTEDLEGASRFYQELFGWSFIDSLSGNPRIKQIVLENRLIGTVVEITPAAKGVNESQWLGYMSVNSVDDATERILRNNGAVPISPRELAQRGRVAVCLDSEGAVFGVTKFKAGGQVEQETEFNRWIGSELWSNDIDKALQFYGSVVGYEVQSVALGNGKTYQVLARGGRVRAGIVKIPFTDVQPNWIPYIAVEDPIAVSKKIEQLGGTLLTEPDRSSPESSAVIIADPAGAVFGIQQVVLNETGDGDRK